MAPRLALLTAVAALLAAPPAALADPPDREGAVTLAAPFAWSGEAAPAAALFSVPEDNAAGFCSKEPINFCDVTLLKVDVRGNLQVDVPDGGDGQTHDFNLQVYKASAGGIASTRLGGSAGVGGPESVLVEDVAPGFYLAFIVYAVSAGLEAPAATATLLPPTTPSAAPVAPAAPSAPTPATRTDAPPASKISRPGRSARARGLRGFSGIASDDVAVAEVHVALTRARGSRCYSLTARGRWTRSARRGGRCVPKVFLLADGAERWSFRLRQRLPRGSYRLFSRAIDNTGKAEPGFGSANTRVFRLR